MGEEILTMPTETIFKIRNRTTHLFSRGGVNPKFDTKGKVWRGIGPIKNHLNVVHNAGKVYWGCEVVKILVHTEDAEVTPVLDLIEEQDKKRADKQQAREEQNRKFRESQERDTLRKLQKKYGTNP
jgi:hypothetical protein